jgi:hypothetical protein
VVFISLILLFTGFVTGQNIKQVKISLASSETVSRLLTAELPLEEGKVNKKMS